MLQAQDIQGEKVLNIIFVTYLPMLTLLYVAILTLPSTLLKQLIKSASAVQHYLLTPR